MRIGYFITHYPYEVHRAGYLCGGMEVAASDLAVQMAAKGHEVSIFTTSIDRHESVERRLAMTVYRYGAAFRIAQANMSLALLSKPLEHEVDIVHAHAGNPPAPIAAMRYARAKGKPLVVTYHMDAEANWGGIVRRASVQFYNSVLLNRVLSNATSIITVSKGFADGSKYLASHMHKVRVIPNGVNAEEFRVLHSRDECRRRLGLPTEAGVLLFMGALSPHKGPDVILRAMPALRGSLPNVKLVFAGDGILRDKLVKATGELGLENQVKFVGFVDKAEDRGMLFKAADALVLPSIQESFGIVILEAMACGVPVVASAVGGVTSLITDGETGLLVQPANPELLARAVTRLLGDLSLRQKLSEAGRRQVYNFSWSRIADQTEELYLEVAR